MRVLSVADRILDHTLATKAAMTDSDSFDAHPVELARELLEEVLTTDLGADEIVRRVERVLQRPWRGDVIVVGDGVRLCCGGNRKWRGVQFTRDVPLEPPAVGTKHEFYRPNGLPDQVYRHTDGREERFYNSTEGAPVLVKK